MTSPFVLFPAFVVVNFLNFIDRAIIPATSNEFLLFISATTTTSRPNIYLGILQSAFIVGFALSSIIFTSLIRTKGPYYVIAMGLMGWVIAAIGAGISLRFHCFWGIFIARMLSGVGEASFVGSAAPWIATNAPIRSKGMWLAVFYTAIPIGTAFGYSYASFVADHIGVDWAFIFIAMAMLPIIAIFSYASLHYSPTIVVDGHTSKLEESFYTATEGPDHGHSPHPHFSIDGDRDASCSHCEELGLPVTSPSASHHLYNDGLVMPGLRQRRNESDGGGYVQLSMQPGDDSFDVSIDIADPSDEASRSPKSSSSRLLYRHRSPINTSISSASSSSSLLDDIVFIIHQPIYVCITLGCAAQVAVMAGLGCFGPSFLMGLEYFTSETSASSSFGMVVLLAGIVGTPVGGLLADYCQTCQDYSVRDLHGSDEGDNEEEEDSSAVTQNDLGDIVVVVDLESSTSSSSPAPLLPSSSDRHCRDCGVGMGDVATSTRTDDVYANVNSNSNNYHNNNANGTNDSVTDSSGLIDCCSSHPSSDPLISEQQIIEQHISGPHVSFSNTEPSPSTPSTAATTTTFRQLKIMMMIVAASTFSATVCLCSTYWVTSRELFMLLVTVGCMLVFLCNPAINLGLMLSVPERYRPLALALTSVCVHIFGDVPSPVITGILKDFIAPACTLSDDININNPSLSTTTGTGTGTGTGTASIIGTVITNIGRIGSLVASHIASQQPILSGTSLAVDSAVGTGLDTLFTGGVSVSTNGPPPLAPPVAPTVLSIPSLSQPQQMMHLPTPCQTYEKWGIHTTMFLVSTWLIVSSMFYVAAWYYAYQAMQQQQDDDVAFNMIQKSNQSTSKQNKKRAPAAVNDLYLNNSLHRHHNPRLPHTPLHKNINLNNSSSNPLLKSDQKGLFPVSLLGSIAARMGLVTSSSSNIVNDNNSSNLKQPLLDGDLSRIDSESESPLVRDRDPAGVVGATPPLTITWT